MYYDPYKILGVQRGAPLGDIKKRYYKMQKRYHPDAGGDDNGDFSAMLSKAWEQIQKESENPTIENRFPVWRHKSLFKVVKV